MLESNTTPLPTIAKSHNNVSNSDDESNLYLFADGSCPDLTIAISAPGKVILHGEHSVVYDKLAVAASLGLRTHLTLNEQKSYQGQQGFIKIELPELGLIHTYNMIDVQNELLNKQLPLTKSAAQFNWEKPNLINHEELLHMVEEFVNKNSGSTPLSHHQQLSLYSLFYLLTGIFGSLNVPLKSFTLKTETNLAISSGSGSSASYSVTIAAALIQYLRLKAVFIRIKDVSKSNYKSSRVWCTSLKKFDDKELEIISNWAFLAEKIIHGTPSGIDNTICTYGSIVEFRKSTGPKQLNLCEFRLLLVNTKVKRDTKRMVKNVLVLKQRHPEIIDLILNAMDEISKNAISCLRQLNHFHVSNEWDELELQLWYDKLGELTDMNQHLLQALGVSHPTLDSICSICKSAGLYCKLTGAGGGGYAISLIPPHITEEQVVKLTENLQSQGFETILTKLGGPGVTID
ncbi:hypothetical protein ILUMI_04909 [Ignelater luminosus]|uniref:Mevalonate kinase n=1 Tax=Ignelater luminosus TaxID=2038154 RepID=A0A8K0GGV8_IGNLU|nr:hypothetical protein ILUMI_04909 [Ignelater luminosus]